jgi:hypothetical protein
MTIRFGVVAVVCISLSVLLPTASMAEQAGLPLRNIDVKLGKNPGGTASARTGNTGNNGAPKIEDTTISKSRSNVKTNARVGH